MSKAITAVRLILGAIFFVFGLNGFLNFIPAPPMNPQAAEFFAGLLATGYLLPLIKLTELISGALLLTHYCVPLALTLLAPIVLNILGFHFFLDKAGLPMAAFIVFAEIFLAWGYRDSFRGVLEVGARPSKV